MVGVTWLVRRKKTKKQHPNLRESTSNTQRVSETSNNTVLDMQAVASNRGKRNSGKSISTSCGWTKVMNGEKIPATGVESHLT